MESAERTLEHNQEALSSFPPFALLPAELRLHIWKHSFEPRTIELHTSASHYAEDRQLRGAFHWRSYSLNPAALSVSGEARAIAMAHYTLRLCVLATRHQKESRESSKNVLRELYINPLNDTIVVMGGMDFAKMTMLVDEIRSRDPQGVGLRRLAISASWINYPGAGPMLRMFVNRYCPNLLQLTIYDYPRRLPPDEWDGSMCSLDDCRGKEYHKRFELVNGHMEDGHEWMVLGSTRFKLAELNFWGAKFDIQQ